MKKNILKFPKIKKTVRKKTTRRRQTKPEVSTFEDAVMRATKELVEAQGFSTLTEAAIIEKAGVAEGEYRERFENLEALIRCFVSKNDYWLGELNIGILDTLGLGAFMQQTCLNLMTVLYGDRVMQRMLIWELDSDNEITRQVARLRETTNRRLIKYFEKQRSHTGADVPVLVALLISGIYYMVMHSGRSTFCGVDFSTPKGKKRLASAINFAVKAIFGMEPPSSASKGAPMFRLLKNDGGE